MGTAELKSEIEKALSDMPQETLESVLNYLHSIRKASPDKITLSGNMRIILEEDGALLKKLAE